MSFKLFLHLPLELRNQVYASYFRSTTLTYPTLTFPPLLFASHQIHTEALPFFHPNASFNLLITEHLVNYLTAIKPEALTQLRHISVRAVPFPVYPLDDGNDDGYYCTHPFPDVLRLFSGLQLDTLLVQDSYHGPDVGEDGWGHNATYYDLEALVREGKGWKELVYTSASDRWLEAVTFETFAADGTKTTETNKRKAQPGTWDRMIKERDGAESGATVEMWVHGEGEMWEKVEGDYHGSIKDGAERDSQDEHGGTIMSSGDLEEDDDDDDDDSLVEERPSIIFRVTRGKGADYVQDGKCINESKSSSALRQMFEEIGWKEIKARGLFLFGAEDDPTARL